jgi:hypothetical protein
VEGEIAMAGYEKRKCCYLSEDSGISLEEYSKTVKLRQDIRPKPRFDQAAFQIQSCGGKQFSYVVTFSRKAIRIAVTVI